MKIFMLPTGQRVKVDDEDFEHISQFAWCLHKDKSHPIGYAQAQEVGTRKHFYMHRMIMQRAGFDITGKIVDHRNLDTLDNRRCNLRLATHSESQHNKGMQRNNKSGHKGVCRHRGKWLVQIQSERKQLARLYFDHLPDAAQASVLLRYLHHGEFANLN